jgi:ParB family chromosome partitioning protein
MNTPQEKPVVLIDPVFEKKVETWKTVLARQLSSRVNVHFTSEGKGKVVIHFDSVEEAEWLMEHLRV